jgi:Bacterial protein of unknown function (DUF924)
LSPTQRRSCISSGRGDHMIGRPWLVARPIRIGTPLATEAFELKVAPLVEVSPVVKNRLREFIAGVIASRKTGDQQQWQRGHEREGEQHLAEDHQAITRSATPQHAGASCPHPSRGSRRTRRLTRAFGSVFSACMKSSCPAETTASLADAQTALAAIVLDQMSRNMFRDTPRAFAADPQALWVAEAAIVRGFAPA